MCLVRLLWSTPQIIDPYSIFPLDFSRFIYRHAPHLAGCLSAICATIITTATRKFFFLGDSGSFVSMGFAVMWTYPPSNMFVNTFTESAALGFGRGSSLSTPAGYRSAPSLLTRVGLADYTPSASGTPNAPSTSSAPTGSHGTCVICDQLPLRRAAGVLRVRSPDGRLPGGLDADRRLLPHLSGAVAPQPARLPQPPTAVGVDAERDARPPRCSRSQRSAAH